MEIKSEKIKDHQEMLDRWKASGKSIMAYCKKENISYYTFLYWRDKLSKKKRRFIKLKIPVYRRTQSHTCEIVFTNGNRINFPTRPEAVYLKALLA